MDYPSQSLWFCPLQYPNHDKGNTEPTDTPPCKVHLKKIPYICFAPDLMTSANQVEKQTEMVGIKFADLDVVRTHITSWTVSKEREIEKLNWHMEFDHVDVGGTEKMVIISIAYRDKYKKLVKSGRNRRESGPKGYLTRIVVPEDVTQDPFDQREDNIKALSL